MIRNCTAAKLCCLVTVLVFSMLMTGFTDKGSADLYLTQKQITHANGDVTKYTYSYDDHWQLITASVCLNGEEISRDDYFYKEEGRLVQCLSSSGDALLDVWEYRREFDTEGDLIRCSTYQNGNRNEITEYTYNSSGRLTEKATRYTGSEMVHRETRTYDTGGNLLSVQLDRGQDSRLKREIVCDASGMQVRESYTRNGTLSGWTDFTYSEDGKQVNARFFGTDEALQAVKVSRYDTHGNLLTEEVYTPDDTLLSRAVYSYLRPDGTAISGS